MAQARHHVNSVTTLSVPFGFSRRKGYHSKTDDLWPPQKKGHLFAFQQEYGTHVLVWIACRNFVCRMSNATYGGQNRLAARKIEFIPSAQQTSRGSKANTASFFLFRPPKLHSSTPDRLPFSLPIESMQ